MSKTPSPARRRQAGLSLIELMISITIGLLILTGVAYVFVNTSDARRELERTSRQLENGRFAIEMLQDDLRLAGFFGELNVSSLSSSSQPATAVPAAVPDPCSTTTSDLNEALHIHVQGYYLGSGAPTTCLISGLAIHPNTDILVVRRLRTCIEGVSGCPAATANTPYIAVSLCSSVVTTHEIVTGTTAPAVKKKDCTTAAGKRQYYVNIYYVSSNNGSGVTVPTLKRLTFTPGTSASTGVPANFTVDPLVEGIERFHVEYGLDTDGDGAPDVYVSNPNDYPASACNASCQVSNWGNVVTAHVYVVSRNLEATLGYSDPKSYTLGTVSYTPATADLGYRRHAYSALVRITNPAGRRDVP